MKLDKDSEIKLSHFYRKIKMLGETMRNYYKVTRLNDENKEELYVLEAQMNRLKDDYISFLNKIGCRLPMAKWVYDPRDTATHKSHKDFGYQHLL